MEKSPSFIIFPGKYHENGGFSHGYVGWNRSVNPTLKMRMDPLDDHVFDKAVGDP